MCLDFLFKRIFMLIYSPLNSIQIRNPLVCVFLRVVLRLKKFFFTKFFPSNLESSRYLTVMYTVKIDRCGKGLYNFYLFMITFHKKASRRVWGT